MAIVEATGLAKFEHQVSKDRVMIAKGFYQQPDQYAADRADQDGKQALIHAQHQGSFRPNQKRALMNEGDEGESNQGADNAQQDDEDMSFM